MRRICIIGNSHIAALKLGLGKRDAEVTFFGSHAGSLRDTTAESGCLIPTNEKVRQDFIYTSNGKDHIRLTNYDEIVLVGLTPGLHRFVSVFKVYRPFGLHKKGKLLISDDAIRCVVDNAANFQQSEEILRKLRSLSDAPIKVLTQPMPSQRIEQSPDWDGFWSSEWPEKIYGFYVEALEKFERNSPVCRQPDDTLSRPWLTKSEFSDGSVRMTGDLTTQHSPAEYWHMNASYGSCMLDLVIGQAIK